MRRLYANHRPALRGGAALESSGEGRDSELSRRLTALVLFPHLDARPGAWLMLLAAMWTLVAVGALELGHF